MENKTITEFINAFFSKIADFFYFPISDVE